MALLPQQTQAVVDAGVPLGGEAVAGPVVAPLEGGRRGQAVLLCEPFTGGTHGLHPDPALPDQLHQPLELGFQTGLDVLPEEIVLLTHLAVLDAQGILLGHAAEVAGHEPGIPSGKPGGLHGDHALHVLPADMILKIVDGIRAQKPENGDVQLHFFGGSGDEGVVPAGEIHAVGPAAPEGEAVGGHLVSADAGGLHAIFLTGVADGHAVHDPRADVGGIIAVNCVEIRHVGIHQELSLLRGVAQTVGTVHPVVVLQLLAGVPKAHTGPAAQGLGDLPPHAKLVVLVQVFLQQLLVPGLHEGIVFQCIGPGEAVLLHQDQNAPQGIEIIHQEPAGLRVGHADEVVNMNNGSLFHDSCSFPGWVQRTRKPPKCQFTETQKHSPGFWRLYRIHCVGSPRKKGRPERGGPGA